MHRAEADGPPRRYAVRTRLPLASEEPCGKPGGKRQLISAPGNLAGLGDETWSSGLPGRPALGGPNPRRNKEKTTRRRESLALSISPLRDVPNPTLHDPRRKWLLRDRKSEQNFRRIYGHEDKGVRVQGPPRKENTTVSVGPLDAAGPQEQGTSGHAPV